MVLYFCKCDTAEYSSGSSRKLTNVEQYRPTSEGGGAAAAAAANKNKMTVKTSRALLFSEDVSKWKVFFLSILFFFFFTCSSLFTFPKIRRITLLSTYCELSVGCVSLDVIGNGPIKSTFWSPVALKLMVFGFPDLFLYWIPPLGFLLRVFGDCCGFDCRGTLGYAVSAGWGSCRYSRR